jgi:hypothetical protein
MSFIKAFVTKHIQSVTAARPSGQEAVAIFFYGDPPDTARITELAVEAEAEVSVGNDEGKTRIALAWPDVSTVITIDPSWDKAIQMQGMRGWTDRFPAKVRELDEVQALIESFDRVTACYGSISKPGLDDGNKVMSLLKALQGNGGGFFFSRNSFYGTDGLRITGFDEDPAWLGTPQGSAE